MPTATGGYTIEQAIAAARAAGWSGPSLIRIVATAVAESRLVPQTNTSAAARCNEGGCPTGILQIKPGYWGQYGDPTTLEGSFRAAHAIVAQQGWSAWETNTVARGHNSYLDFVDEVRAAVGGASAAVSAVGRWLSPFRGSAPVTQKFGPTNFALEGPHQGYPHFHEGIDFGTPQGTPVQSVAAGRVLSAGPLGGYGNTIEVDLGNGLTALYGHLSQLLVSPGQSVAGGTVLGLSGGTPGTPGAGVSDGPHLHFGVRQNGTFVDPAAFLYGEGGAQTGQTFGETSTASAAGEEVKWCIHDDGTFKTPYVMPAGGCRPGDTAGKGAPPDIINPTSGLPGLGDIAGAIVDAVGVLFPKGSLLRLMLGAAGVAALVLGLFVVANDATGGAAGDAAKAAATTAAVA